MMSASPHMRRFTLCMSSAPVQLDERECTTCGYSLRGITLTNCPECGHDVHSDPAFYTPSRAPTPFSRLSVMNLLRGVVWVLFKPIKTFEACASPVRVTRRSAIVFAMVCVVITVIGWPIIRAIGIAASIAIYNRDPSAFMSWTMYELREPLRYHTRTLVWETLSLLRWWVLFALLAAVAPNRRGCRVLLFAPWISVVEVLFLIGAWIGFGGPVVPEPSSLFAMESLSLWENATERIWLVRGIAVIPVGVTFFRAVFAWRWRWSILASLAFCPVAVVVSVQWTLWYLKLDLLNFPFAR
jgi:hypothetical protein